MRVYLCILDRDDIFVFVYILSTRSLVYMYIVHLGDTGTIILIRINLFFMHQQQHLIYIRIHMENLRHMVSI